MNKQLLILLLATLAVSGWLFALDQNEYVPHNLVEPLRPNVGMGKTEKMPAQQVMEGGEVGEIRDLFLRRRHSKKISAPPLTPPMESASTPTFVFPPIKYLGRKLDGSNDLAILEVNGIPAMYSNGDVIAANWSIEEFGPNDLVLKDMRDQSIHRVIMGSLQ